MSDNPNINGTVVRIETNAATKTFPKIECGSIFMALDGCLYVKIQKLVSKAPSRKCFNAVELRSGLTHYFGDNDYVYAFDACSFNYEI